MVADLPASARLTGYSLPVNLTWYSALTPLTLTSGDCPSSPVSALAAIWLYTVDSGPIPCNTGSYSAGPVSISAAIRRSSGAFSNLSPSISMFPSYARKVGSGRTEGEEHTREARPRACTGLWVVGGRDAVGETECRAFLKTLASSVSQNTATMYILVFALVRKLLCFRPPI